MEFYISFSITENNNIIIYTCDIYMQKTTHTRTNCVKFDGQYVFMSLLQKYDPSPFHYNHIRCCHYRNIKYFIFFFQFSVVSSDRFEKLLYRKPTDYMSVDRSEHSRSRKLILTVALNWSSVCRVDVKVVYVNSADDITISMA